MLLRRTLNCDSDLPGGSFDWGHSMAVLLIDAFSIVILNLAIPGRSFCYDTSWNSFDCGIHWKYLRMWNFLTVLWIVILPCNTVIVVLSDRTLDMSVVFSGSPFVFTLPGSTFVCNTPLQSFGLWYSPVVFVSTAILIFVNWNAPLQSFLLL